MYNLIRVILTRKSKPPSKSHQFKYISLPFREFSTGLESTTLGQEEDDWTSEELQREYVDKMTAVAIPVNITIHGQQTILDLSTIENLLREAEIITLQDCSCRTKWHKCDAPIDVCISLDDEARDALKFGARRISLAQALVALQCSHHAGLVHMAFTFKDKEKPEVICSCCSCCCHSLSALVRFGMPEAVVASQYIAQQNSDTCSNCGTCVKRCQFKSRQLDSQGKLVFNSTKCFGCGLCVSTCPTKSITLVRRGDSVQRQPNSFWKETIR
jgi:Pyruvate/2-oxoacid:ferredoxin oxidoreductase delta subunit